MKKLVHERGLFAGNYSYLQKKTVRGNIKAKLLLSLFILLTIQAFNVGFAKGSKYNCFSVSIDEFRDNPKQVSFFINQLLRLEYVVYRSAQQKEYNGIVIKSGDFIIEMESNERKEVFLEYLRKENFVDGRYINFPLEMEVYLLRKGKVAVYDGNYAQGGADLHVKTLTELGFNVRLIGDADLFDSKLIFPEFIAIILPGLGGDGGSVWYSPGVTGREKLQEFVKSGGGVFGTCAGAGLIVQKIDFNDEMPSFYLNLAPISHSVTFRGRGLVKEKILDRENPIFYGLEDAYYIMHVGGGGMHALNDNAKPVAVYSSLDRFHAKPWAYNYFNWDIEEKTLKKDNPPKSEEEAKKWLEPYLNNTNYASTIVAKNGKGLVVATGNHPEILAQAKAGHDKWDKKIIYTWKDIAVGYMYEANVIYFLTQGKKKKIALKKFTSDLENVNSVSFYKGEENIFTDKYQRLIEKVEGDIMELDSLMKYIGNVETEIDSWDKVNREVHTLEKTLHTIKEDIIIAQNYQIGLTPEEWDEIKDNFILINNQLKEARKLMFYIKNTISAFHYAVKQKEKVKGQFGLNYSADNKEEGWTTIENYLKIYLSNVSSFDSNVNYVFGPLSKSPAYSLNMVLHQLKMTFVAMHQENIDSILKFKLNNLMLN